MFDRPYKVEFVAMVLQPEISLCSCIRARLPSPIARMASDRPSKKAKPLRPGTLIDLRARERKRARNLGVIRAMSPEERLHAFFSLCESGAWLRRMGKNAP